MYRRSACHSVFLVAQTLILGVAVSLPTSAQGPSTSEELSPSSARQGEEARKELIETLLRHDLIEITKGKIWRLTVFGPDMLNDVVPLLCPSPEIIDFRSRCQFGREGNAIGHVLGCENLQVLVCHVSFDVDEEFMRQAVQLKKLRYLVLDGATFNESVFKFDESSLAHLAQAESLQELSLRRMNVTDAAIEYLANVPVKALDLGETKVTADGVRRLAGHKTLRQLVVSQELAESAELADDLNPIELASAEDWYYSFGNRHEVRTRRNKNKPAEIIWSPVLLSRENAIEELTEQKAIEVVDGKVRRLVLQGVPWAPELAKMFCPSPDLVDFRTICSPGIVREVIDPVLGCENLEILMCHVYFDVGDDFLKRVSQLDKLRLLRLDGAVFANEEFIFDHEALAHLANAKSLRELSLRWMPITDEALPHLGELKLECLDLGMTHVTAAGLEKLKGHKTLRKLVVDSELAESKALAATLDPIQLVPTERWVYGTGDYVRIHVGDYLRVIERIE